MPEVMDETQHTVTLPLKDYRQLKTELSNVREQFEQFKNDLSYVQDFVSILLGEIEDPEPLIDQFNKNREGVTVIKDGKDVAIEINQDKLSTDG